MPVYEYKCTKCDTLFERIQTMMEEHISDCPECGSNRTDRIFSIPTIKVITDAELSQRMMGVPRQRINKARELRDDREKRHKSPESERDLVSNELHLPKKRRRQ